MSSPRSSESSGRRRAFQVQAPQTARTRSRSRARTATTISPDGEQGRLWDDAGQMEPRVVLKHGPELVPALEHLPGDAVAALPRLAQRHRHQAARHSLAVAHPRIRRDDHARAEDLRPPGEVEVLAEGRDAGVEALQLPPEIGPDEHAAPGGHEHVAHGVVLAVVDLALRDAVDDRTRLVAPHPDVQQDGSGRPN